MLNNNKVVAMILAGGKGTRLEALTKKTAKPAEAAPKRERNTSMNKPKLSYKEQRLLEQTEIDIDNLSKEKKEIEERLGSGEQMSNDEIMNGLIQHAMAADFGFGLSAEEYARTYLWML